MKNSIIFAAIALALLIVPAQARGNKQAQTTVLDPVPVAGTVAGSTVTFVRNPRLDRVVPYAGYLACSPFELLGARCR